MCTTCENGFPLSTCNPGYSPDPQAPKMRPLNFEEMIEQASLDFDMMADFSSSTCSASSSPALSTVSLNETVSSLATAATSSEMGSPIPEGIDVPLPVAEEHEIYYIVNASRHGSSPPIPIPAPLSQVPVKTASDHVPVHSTEPQSDHPLAIEPVIASNALCHSSSVHRESTSSSPIPTPSGGLQSPVSPSKSKRRRSSTSSSLRAKPSSPKKRQPEPLLCAICGQRQNPKRSPDFKRHMKTHEEKVHFCWGVELGSLEADGLDKSKASNWNGEMRIGGCGRAFSRLDALRRHLKNRNNRCIGRV